MLRTGTQDSYIRNRVNMPTARSHAELTQMDPKIRAQSFFSARVAEAHILDRLREVSDRYSRGEIGLGEARNTLKDFLKAEGYDPHKAGLKNLASTARLNLVMRQNAAMANAAAEWKRMHDPDAMTVFPYVRYHSRKDSRSRDGHKKLDGKIFRKDDPFLKTHTPPWEFNCRCWLEEITAKEAGRESENVQEPTPPEDVTIDSDSGFSFDPEHAFETFDLASVKDIGERRNIHGKMAKIASNHNNLEITLAATIQQPIPTCTKPDNLDEIRQVLSAVKKNVDERSPGEQWAFPEISCSLGRIARERFDALGMQPDDDVEVILESPGASDYGMKHWKKHHADDIKNSEFVKNTLEMLSKTVWEPSAVMTSTHSTLGKRISIESPDGKYIASLWRRGDKWVYSIQDAWDQSQKKKENPRTKTKQ